MSNKLLADSNRASLREAVEATTDWGVTPANGVTRAIRFTSSSISVKKDTAVSNEIRDDRMVSSVIETAASSGGEINFEFSAGNQDSFLERALMSYFTRPMTFDFFRGQNVSISDATHVVIAGTDVSAYFTVGRRVKLSGFLNPANNTFGQISVIAFAGGNTTLTLTSVALVAEAGSAHTTVADANDVLVLNSVAIAAGTAGAPAFDSGGGNAFAAIRAAGQLNSGQIIHVEGLGYESATITLASVVAGDILTLSDGGDPVTFVAGTDYDISGNDTADAAALAAAINAHRVSGFLQFVASSALGVVTVINLNKVGGSITEAAATITETAFSGGNAALGGFYTIITATDDVITVDRPVATVAAGAKVTIRGSMLRNPSLSTAITPQSSTIETRFFDVQQSFITDGLRTGGVSFNISSNAILTGSIKIEGRQTIRQATAKLSNAVNYTPLDANACENVSATANVGALKSNGIALTTAIKSIEMNIEGNLRQQQAVGSKFPVGIAAGRLNVTGKLDAYFADGLMYDHFLEHDTVSLQFPVTDVDGNTYYFTIPAFKVLSDPVAPGGIDQDVMEQMEFTAFRDGATKCMVQIDRFSSVHPVTSF
jgi:hypothetical protein